MFRRGARENGVICGHDELNGALSESGHVVLICCLEEPGNVAARVT